MDIKCLCAEKHLDAGVGFRYRKVLLTTEHSALHCHKFYELFLSMSDNLRHEVNGVSQTLSRGSLLFIRKGDRHYYPDSLKATQSFINLAFSEEVLTQLFVFLSEGFCGNLLLSAPLPPQVQLNDKDIDWMVRQLDELNTTLLHDTVQRQYQCRLFLFRIFTRYFAVFRDKDTFIPAWLHALDKEMQHPENFAQGAERMVALSGKSREHVCRSVKKYYGQSLSEYINDRRLNFLANSLLTTNLPIIDLCYASGFENTAWAYTLFKRKYGTSPAKFRKNS